MIILLYGSTKCLAETAKQLNITHSGKKFN